MMDFFLNLAINQDEFTMYQRDYILRMIEMIGEFIAVILGRINKGEFVEASQAIENAYMDFLKQDAAFFLKIHSMEMTDTLLHQHNYTGPHLLILSRLFYADAELSYAMGDFKRSLDLYKRSLVLLDFTIHDSKTFSPEDEADKEQLTEKIRVLEEKVEKKL